MQHDTHHSFPLLIRIASPARLVFTVLLVLIMMPVLVAQAQSMHRWVDEDGQVHFSQTPPPDQASQDSEIVRYREDKRGNVDHACCERVRELAITASSNLQRGLTFAQLQQEFPASTYPYLTEIFNYVSPAALAGESPSSIGSRAFGSCVNRSFQACRVNAPQAVARGRTNPSSGSGAVLEGGLVITNSHVISGCNEITVSDQQVRARVLAADSGTDLAILETSLSDQDAVPLTAAQYPTLGQPIVAAGYPLSDKLESLNFTTGIVSSEAGLIGDYTRFQITAPVQPGNSGGPVFDSGGRLLGIVVSRLRDSVELERYGVVPQNVNFAISPSAIKAFLRENDIKFRVSDSQYQLTTEVIAEQAKRNTVRVFCYP